MELMFKYLWEKFLIAIPTCYLTFTQDQTNVLHGITYVVIIDTILGVWVAVTYKVFASHQLSRIFGKISRYALAMGSVWIISAIEPEIFGWLFHWTGIFIIITEIFSNFEKLALLGFVIPGKILSKLNKQFLIFFEEKDEKKDIIAEEILKNRETREL